MARYVVMEPHRQGWRQIGKPVSDYQKALKRAIDLVAVAPWEKKGKDGFRSTAVYDVVEIT